MRGTLPNCASPSDVGPVPSHPSPVYTSDIRRPLRPAPSELLTRRESLRKIQPSEVFYPLPPSLQIPWFSSRTAGALIDSAFRVLVPSSQAPFAERALGPTQN